MTPEQIIELYMSMPDISRALRRRDYGSAREQLCKCVGPIAAPRVLVALLETEPRNQPTEQVLARLTPHPRASLVTSR